MNIISFAGKKIISAVHYIVEGTINEYLKKDSFPGGFDRYKCVFIHMPKVAGTSICKSLFGYQIGHRKYQHYFDDNAIKTKKYYKFSFVRNPWDRLLSAYLYMINGSVSSPPEDKLWAKENIEKYDDFNGFVKGWVNGENIYKHSLFVPQNEYLCNQNGVIKVDFVGRYENLEQDFEHVCNVIGAKIILPKINVTEHKHYSDYYDDESADIVRRVYRIDVATFGYKFEREGSAK